MLTDHEEDFYVVKTFTFGINFEDRTTNIETKVFECFFAISECLAIWNYWFPLSLIDPNKLPLFVQPIFPGLSF